MVVAVGVEFHERRLVQESEVVEVTEGVRPRTARGDAVLFDEPIDQLAPPLAGEPFQVCEQDALDGQYAVAYVAEEDSGIHPRDPEPVGPNLVDQVVDPLIPHG